MMAAGFTFVAALLVPESASVADWPSKLAGVAGLSLAIAAATEFAQNVAYRSCATAVGDPTAACDLWCYDPVLTTPRPGG
jgi:hypothetical protein